MPSEAISSSVAWIRHVKRGTTSDFGAVEVAGFAVFAPQPLEGINGRQGWVSAQPVRRLSDDGEFTITFPNAIGDDGISHRERFGLTTSDKTIARNYRPGEEWLEFYREANDLLFTGTIVKASISRNRIVLTGYDLPGYLNRTRAGDLEVWEHPPRDVIDHYSRLPFIVSGKDFLADGWSIALPPSGTTSDGWTYDNVLTNAGGGAGMVGASALSYLASPLSDTSLYIDEEYTFDVRGRWTSVPTSTSVLRLSLVGLSGGNTITVEYRPLPGSGTIPKHRVTITSGMLGNVVSERASMTDLPGDVAIRVVQHERWVLVYLQGELVLWTRSTAFGVRTSYRVEVEGGNFALERWKASHLAPLYNPSTIPFVNGDVAIPGNPPSGGLRARYYDETATAGRWGSGTTDFLHHVLDLLAEPKVERIDAQINQPTATAWQPAEIPSTGHWSARWTGSLKLPNLASSDHKLRIGVTNGAIRFWYGFRSIFNGPMVDVFTLSSKSDVRSIPSIRTWLARAYPGGITTDWVPFVFEFAGIGACSLTLEYATVDGSGNPTSSWTAVPSTWLSPFGIFSDTIRRDSRREAIDSVAKTFGYQWVCEPRSLESGRFPGAIVPRARAGRDTDVRITSDDGVDAQVDIDSGDAVDELLLDAGGIADPKGSGQITVEATDLSAARQHFAVITDSESISEISEISLARQRIESLLELRGSPNEQVGVRPYGNRELADTFPLNGSPSRMLWEPGDGVILDQPEIGVVDQTPRQLTSIGWPMTPLGVGVPEVGFRQRPRSVRNPVRRALRIGTSLSRNYQGQFVAITGSLGSTPATATNPDPYSRLFIPDRFSTLVKVELCVLTLNTGTGWTIYVNGVSVGVLVPGPGPYDITRFVLRDAPAGSRLFVTMVGGSGIAEFYVVATVLV